MKILALFVVLAGVETFACRSIKGTVCVMGPNGPNYYSAKQAPKKYEMMPVKRGGFVLFTHTTLPGMDQKINLLNMQLLLQLEELLIINEQMEQGSSRNQAMQSRIRFILRLLNLAMELSITGDPHSIDWHSRGPDYLATLRTDADRARCLSRHFQNYLGHYTDPHFAEIMIEHGIEVPDSATIGNVENDLLRCGFLDLNYEGETEYE